MISSSSPASRSPLAGRRDESDLTLAALTRLADRYAVPLVDAMCIALNLFGLGSKHRNPRMRYRFIPRGEVEAFLIITPTGVPDSPFALHGDVLRLGPDAVGQVPHAENDDVVISYLREAQRQLTLNSNSRSTCTGCVFCPNVIEDPADAKLKSIDDLDRFVRWVIADYGWPDLSHLTKISLSTGCFHADRAAIAHLDALRTVTDRHGFRGAFHLLSSVIRSYEAIRECVELLGSFHLTVTFECTTRRALLLKETKADLHLDACVTVLDNAVRAGADVDVTYIAGLDPFDVARDTLIRLAAHVTTFPRIQIFQAHNALMRAHQASDANRLEWYLALRRAVEPAFARRGLRPRPFENYRPLWYTDFAGTPITGPRI